MADKSLVDDKTLHVMRELLRQPPKPHDQMKLGKPRVKRRESPDDAKQEEDEK